MRQNFHETKLQVHWLLLLLAPGQAQRQAQPHKGGFEQRTASSRYDVIRYGTPKGRTSYLFLEANVEFFHLALARFCIRDT